MSEVIKYNFVEKAVIITIAAIVGLITTFLAIFAASGVCLAIFLPDTFSTVISGMCLGIGSLVGGFLSAKKIKRGGIINGAICGSLIALIIFLISLFVSHSSFSFIGLSHFLIAILSASIGGILGINSSAKRKLIQCSPPLLVDVFCKKNKKRWNIFIKKRKNCTVFL